MKQILFTIATFFLFQFGISQKTIKVDYLISNVSVIPINTETVLLNKDVVVNKGKILAIVDNKKGKYKAKQIIDGAGKYLLPTLSDAHVHLPKNEESLNKIFSLFLINGITKIRSMRGEEKHIE